MLNKLKDPSLSKTIKPRAEEVHDTRNWFASSDGSPGQSKGTPVSTSASSLSVGGEVSDPGMGGGGGVSPGGK